MTRYKVGDPAGIHIHRLNKSTDSEWDRTGVYVAVDASCWECQKLCAVMPQLGYEMYSVSNDDGSVLAEDDESHRVWAELPTKRKMSKRSKEDALLAARVVTLCWLHDMQT